MRFSADEDTQPPSVPTGLNVSASSSSTVSLSWYLQVIMLAWLVTGFTEMVYKSPQVPLTTTLIMVWLPERNIAIQLLPMMRRVIPVRNARR